MEDSVTILIPAHNKGTCIAETIRSIRYQNYNNYNLILILDNCTDDTEEKINNSEDLKFIKDYIIIHTKDNKNKRAGALNQVIFKTEGIKLSEYLLILDADTMIIEDTIKIGVNKLLSDDKLGAVCSKAGVLEYGGGNLWESFLWTIQHIEYAQFDSHRVETEGKIKVAHGMCTIFRKKALMEVAEERFKRYNLKDNIYLDDNLVEDYELTIMLKLLGWKVSACDQMKAFTDVPLSLKAIYKQRLRWLRGGVDTLRFHGFNRITLNDRLSNVLFVFMNIMRLMILVDLVLYVLGGGVYIPNILILTVFGLINIDSFYRLKYVENLKASDISVKLLILPEILYFWFQSIVMAISLIYSYLNVKQKW